MTQIHTDKSDLSDTEIKLQKYLDAKKAYDIAKKSYFDIWERYTTKLATKDEFKATIKTYNEAYIRMIQNE